MRPNFDTLELADTLTAHGLTPEAARAFVRSVRESQIDLASKDDLRVATSELRGEMRQMESRLDAKIDGVKNALDAKIDGVKSSLDAKIDGVKSSLELQISKMGKELAETAHKQTLWLLGGMAGLFGLFGAIQHFFK